MDIFIQQCHRELMQKKKADRDARYAIDLGGRLLCPFLTLAL